MSKLLVVESHASAGLYTRAVCEHTPDAFESVSYVAEAPIPEVKGTFIPSGEPCIGYTHVLLVGDPTVIAKNQIPPDMVHGAFVLSPSQFIPVEEVAWLSKMRVAVPSQLTAAALNLAAGTEQVITEIIPWGFPAVPEALFNKTEYLQTLVPAWEKPLTTFLAPIEYSPLICPVLSRGLPVRILFQGIPTDPTGFMDMYSLNEQQVAFTMSDQAWLAADAYLGLAPATTWPWDVIKALSYNMPVLAINAYVYQTLIAAKMVLPIQAFDIRGAGRHMCYMPNSTDIGSAMLDFVNHPAKGYVYAHNGRAYMQANTPKLFVHRLLKALFSSHA